MIRLLAKSIREYKRDALLTPLFVTLEVIIECIIPFLTANLVWEIQTGCELSTILTYGIILIVLAGFSLYFGRIAGITAASASAGYARNLRRDMFYNIQNFSFANIDRFSTSSLVTRMTTDVTNVQMAFMMIIRGAIRFPLMLVFSVIMAFLMGGSMAFIFLFTIPVLAIGLAIIICKVHPLFVKVFRKYDTLNNSIQENVQAMRVVKSYVREEFEKKKFSSAAEDVCRDFTRAHCWQAVLPVRLQLSDPGEPDDAVHGVCDDYHFRRVRPPYRGGTPGAQHHHQPRVPRHGGGRRLHRL